MEHTFSWETYKDFFLAEYPYALAIHFATFIAVITDENVMLLVDTSEAVLSRLERTSYLNDVSSSFSGSSGTSKLSGVLTIADRISISLVSSFAEFFPSFLFEV